MKINLTTASTQWRERPADERFWTPEEMAKATLRIHESRQVAVTEYGKLEATWDAKTGLRLTSRNNKFGNVAFSNWGFRQFCDKVGAPRSFLVEELQPKTVAQVLNELIAKKETAGREARVSIRTDMKIPHVECFMSDKFAYIPNYRVAQGVQQLTNMGWRTAPARPAGKITEGLVRRATKADILQNSKIGWDGNIKVGDLIGPAGLYASDRDMFAFLISEGKPIDDGSGKHGLNRGIFITNSEVGAGAFTITTFLYDGVCGNHIVWGAEDIHKISVRHLGEKADANAFRAMQRDLDTYMVVDGGDLTKKMKAARKLILGKNKEEVTTELFNNRSIGVGLRDLESAFDLAERLDSKRMDPTSLWGMVSGVTRLSQLETSTRARTRLDAASAKMMTLVN